MKISIIKVEPLNFSLKNKEEKTLIISQFQKFLNSLDFTIQILITTDTLNLDTYLAKLEERVEAVSKDTQNDYTPILDDFKKHMQNIIQNQKLFNRSFYLVVPEKDNIGLEIQLGVCQGLLTSINLHHNLLPESELNLLLRGFFHDLYQEVSSKSIAPELIINNKAELQFGNTFTRTISVKGYPRSVEEGFLDKIITLNGCFDISLRIEPYAIETKRNVKTAV